MLLILEKPNSAYVSVITVCLLLTTTTMTQSWSSPSVPKLTNSTTNPFGRNVTFAEVSWMTSLISMGSAVGPFVFGWMPDTVGMRITLLSLGIPFLVGQLLMAFSTTIEVFYVARFVEGLAVGGTFTVTPNYVGEIAEKANRGALGCYYSIAGSFGVLFSYSLGPYVSTMAFNLVIAIIAAEFLVLFFLVGEECPHYFLNNQDTDAARKVLRRLRGRASKEITEMELQTIKAKIDADGKGNFLDIFRNRRLTKAFAIVIALLMFHQSCGATLASFYSQTLFEEIGTSIPADTSTIIVGGISFLSSFLGPLLVDRLGRKKTMYMSSSGIMASEIVLVVYMYLRDQGKDMSGLNFLPIAALAGVFCFYTCGLAFLPFIIVGEIFPSKVKGPAAILALSFNFVMNFLVTKYVEFFFKSFGIAQTFTVCAGFTFFSLVFCRFCLIETSGRSLEEIQEIL